MKQSKVIRKYLSVDYPSAKKNPASVKETFAHNHHREAHIR